MTLFQVLFNCYLKIIRLGRVRCNVWVLMPRRYSLSIKQSNTRAHFADNPADPSIHQLALLRKTAYVNKLPSKYIHKPTDRKSIFTKTTCIPSLSLIVQILTENPLVFQCISFLLGILTVTKYSRMMISVKRS